MKLSTRGRYATRALLELALHNPGGSATLKDIAQKQNISLRYLEHLITPLIAAGLVRTTRGPRGGISLAKAPSDIKLSEVVQLLEGSIAPVECVDNPSVCPRSDDCASRDVWCQVNNAVTTVLNSVTLLDLVECHQKKGDSEQVAYFV